MREREIWMWLLAGLTVLVLFGCLALAVINARSGFQVEGQQRRFWLESAVTNYPFCPPRIPCPISMVLDHNNFVVWVVWQSTGPTAVETGYRRLVNIPLPK